MNGKNWTNQGNVVNVVNNLFTDFIIPNRVYLLFQFYREVSDILKRSFLLLSRILIGITKMDE